MKFFSTLLFFILSTVVSMAQPIYRLNNLLWENYDTASFKPYARVDFTYSGNRQGIYSNPDEIERLIIEASLTDSLLQPIPGLFYDSLRYMRFDNPAISTQVARQIMDNTGRIQYYTLYDWNAIHQKYEQYKEYEFFYNGAAVTRTINFYTDSVIYYYNTTGLPDSIDYVKKQQKEIFVYNQAGDLAEKIIKGTTDTPAHIYYYYDAVHRVQAMLNMRALNDTAQANYYVYSISGDFESDMERISYAPHSPLINYTWKFHKHSNHNRTGTEILLRDSKDPSIWNYDLNLGYHYNSYGFIEKAILQSFNKNAIPALYVNVRQFSFNYELAWPVNIAHQQTSRPTIQLYPNPAGEIFTFRISTETPQPLTACITDMQGRVLMQWKEAATKEYTRTIPTAALPAGTYVLKVNGEGWEQAKMFSVR